MTSSKNILSSDVEIKGKLRFSNDLIIDGRIEGVVGFGKVHGNISVTDRWELKQNAELHGDVVANKLAIEEGAAFLGASTVGGPAKPSGSSKPASSPSPNPGGSGGNPSGDGGGPK